MMSNPASSRILVVIGSLEVGGTERHLCHVMPRLNGNGFDISIVAFHHRGALAAEIESLGVTVISPSFPSWLRRWRPLLALACFFWLGRVIARQRPDVVHMFLPESYLLAGIWTILLRVPGRIMSRRSLNHYQTRYPTLARLERWLHGRMSLLLGNSAAVVAQLEQEAASQIVPIRLVHNGIDTTRFDRPQRTTSLRGTLGITDDALVISVVANFIAYKGHADLLAAIGSVTPVLPSSWRLICIGRDDGILDSLVARAHELGIGANMLWLGQRDDVPELLAASDFGILASHEEGLSNAILEGMAARLPMVVTDVGGNTELVVDNETGLIVPAHEPEALGRAIVRLADDATLRRDMGARARQRLEARFSLDRCIEGYRQAYADIVHSGERAGVA